MMAFSYNQTKHAILFCGLFQINGSRGRKGAARSYFSGASCDTERAGCEAHNIQGKKLIIYLYKAIVIPHLEYCILEWRPYHKKDIDTLERIQIRATNIIPELRDLSYEE